MIKKEGVAFSLLILIVSLLFLFQIGFTNSDVVVNSCTGIIPCSNYWDPVAESCSASAPEACYNGPFQSYPSCYETNNGSNINCDIAYTSQGQTACTNVINGGYCTWTEGVTQNSCSDSDGGDNRWVFGTVYESPSGNAYSDSCSVNVLTEYFCYISDPTYPNPFGPNNNTAVSNTYDCALSRGVCSSGKCVCGPNSHLAPYSNMCSCDQDYPYYYNGICNAVPSVNSTCSDSDGGIVVGTFGFVSTESTSYNDTCLVGGDGIREYYCIGNVVDYVEQTCENTCSNGACQSATFCYDTDGGIDYSEQGTATTNFGVHTDYCREIPYSYYLYEYSCSGSSLVTQMYSCPYGCSEDQGICNPEPPTFECFDTDGGISIYEEGTVTLNGEVSQFDECSSDLAFVNERYCSADNSSILSKNFGCPDGCSNGACKSSSSPGCFDTDGGTNFHAKGTVIIDGEPFGEDYCFGPEGDNLFEYFCNGDSASSTSITCKEGCSSGRCLSEVITLPNQLYWANPQDLAARWTNWSYQSGSTFQVALVKLSPEIQPPYAPVFYVYEADSWPNSDDEVGYFTSSILDINGDGEMDAYYVLTINQARIDAISDSDSDGTYEFFFDIEGETSPQFTITQDLGFCNDNGICEPELGEDETCGDCVAPCAGINFCSEYTEINGCEWDTCNVAGQTPPPAGQGQIDACGWDENKDPKCSKAIYFSTVDGNAVGSCTSEQSSTSEECVGGFLSYSWTSIWNWASSNNFEIEGQCENYSPDCVGNCSLLGGYYHCDPYGAFASCENGFAQVPCPAQIQLSFFDLRNVIVALLLIFVLYVIFYKKKGKKVLPKKKVKKTISKKKRK